MEIGPGASVNLSIDLETYSQCPLKKAGMYRYAEHPSTKVLCMAYAINDQEPELWLPGDPVPEVFNQALPSWAWNAGFEAAIWKQIMAPRHGFPEIPISQWRDTMALSNYCGYPAALFKASEAIGTETKNAAGWRLINLLCKGEPDRGTPQDYQELYEYCKQDVRAERSVHNALPIKTLPHTEQNIWLLNTDAAFHGTYLDVGLVNSLVRIRDKEKIALNARMNVLTGLNITQTGALVDWLRNTGLEIDSIAKASVQKALSGDLTDSQREVLTIRSEAAKTSTAKLDAMLIAKCDDDKIRGMVQYYAAGTGRFAGRIVQLQNLPRGSFKVGEAHVIIAKQFPDAIGAVYTPTDFCSTLIRACLVPTPGKHMYVGDYNAIEARVLAWLAGCEDLLGLFRSGADPYVDFAAKVFNKPISQVTDSDRFLGKTATLGLGYQMGADRFRQTCIDWGVGDPGKELANSTVRLFRDTYAEITLLWGRAFNAFLGAVRNPGQIYTIGPAKQVKVGVVGSTLIVRMPSGSTIMYPEVKVEKVQKTWPNGDKSMVTVVSHMGIDSTSKKWVRKQLYGGRIVENCSQRIARDVMCDAMLPLESKGFELLFTVHDELVVESTNPDLLQNFIDLMETVPEWANGLPLKVGANKLLRYQK